MMITYKPLWKTLIDKDMKKMDLVEDGTVSRGTLAKMGKNQKVSLDVVERICKRLQCKVEEVIVYDEDFE
nr:helix-turn-helix domain-containing protein [Acetatifactor muris]